MLLHGDCSTQICWGPMKLPAQAPMAAVLSWAARRRRRRRQCRERRHTIRDAVLAHGLQSPLQRPGRRQNNATVVCVIVTIPRLPAGGRRVVAADRRPAGPAQPSDTTALAPASTRESFPGISHVQCISTFKRRPCSTVLSAARSTTETTQTLKLPIPSPRPAIRDLLDDSRPPRWPEAEVSGATVTIMLDSKTATTPWRQATTCRTLQQRQQQQQHRVQLLLCHPRGVGLTAPPPSWVAVRGGHCSAGRRRRGEEEEARPIRQRHPRPPVADCSPRHHPRVSRRR